MEVAMNVSAASSFGLGVIPVLLAMPVLLLLLKKELLLLLLPVAMPATAVRPRRAERAQWDQSAAKARMRWQIDARLTSTAFAGRGEECERRDCLAVSEKPLPQARFTPLSLLCFSSVNARRPLSSTLRPHGSNCDAEHATERA